LYVAKEKIQNHSWKNRAYEYQVCTCGSAYQRFYHLVCWENTQSTWVLW
jgi:hypothetical protein